LADINSMMAVILYGTPLPKQTQNNTLNAQLINEIHKLASHDEQYEMLFFLQC